MASSAIIYYTSKTNSDGSHPIVVRLIFDRVPKYVSIANVKKEFWDENENLVKKSHPNYKSINNKIKIKDALASDLLLAFEKPNSGLSQEKILNQLRGKKASETFLDFFSDYVEEQFKKNMFYEATSIEGMGKNIWSFHNDKEFKKEYPDLKRADTDRTSIFRNVKSKEFRFSTITPSFLRNLDIYLKAECDLGERSIWNHMNVIRTVYNRAIEAKAITRDDYPFSGKSGYSMSVPESQKIALEENEVIKLEETELKERTDTWLHARNAWLLSLCWGGARITDVLTTKWDEISEEALHYVMGKNNKPVEVPLVGRAKKILKFYEADKEKNRGYIFPFLNNANLNDPKDVKRKLKNAVRILNVWLKELATKAGIKKKLNNHLARHTFGNLSGDKIPIQTLQLIYRHSDITTTINYQRHWMNKQKVGEAVKTVLNF